MSDDPDYLDDDLPSKTQRKKDAHAQQELGQRLTALPDALLEELPLTDPLLVAIAEYKRIPKKHGALKRQLQYIGRLIRDCDKEAIEAAILLQQQPVTQVSASDDKHITAEHWCSVILREGDAGIQQLVAVIPAINRQELRQLYRNYSRATDSKKAAAEQRIVDYLRPFLPPA